MRFFGSKSESLVGLDVGSSAVKLVSLTGGRSGYQLRAVGSELLPSKSIVDGAIVKREEIAEAIRRIFQVQEVKSDRVSTSVSGHSVIVKKITLPVQTPEEVRESIQWEAEQYIPFDIADVYLDYHVVGPTEDGSQTNVILVAAKRDTIDDHSDVITLADKMPMIVDIDSFALHNVYETNYEPKDEEVAALLNIGASLMNVNIAQGQEMVFTRDIAMGGDYYTEYLQRDLGVSYEEAEEYKLGNAPEELQVSVSSVLQSVSEILVLEIQKTFDYFRTAAQFDEIQTIYICGGASRTEGLRDYLEETFQVAVEFLDPFKNIAGNGVALPEEGSRNGFAIAVGLALRSQGDGPGQGSASGGAGGLAGLVDKLKQMTGRS